MKNNNELVWRKVIDNDELAEGSLVSITCEHHSLCIFKQNQESRKNNRCQTALGVEIS